MSIESILYSGVQQKHTGPNVYIGSIPIIFAEHRGWSHVRSALPFLALLVGSSIGAAINVYNQIVYNKKAAGKVAPELRLPPMMFGSVAFSSGLFITGWTADPQYPWIAPVIGISLTGIGFFTIFQAALNYLVDTFQLYAASAVAANTFLRSCFAGAYVFLPFPPRPLLSSHVPLLLPYQLS